MAAATPSLGSFPCQSFPCLQTGSLRPGSRVHACKTHPRCVKRARVKASSPGDCSLEGCGTLAGGNTPGNPAHRNSPWKSDGSVNYDWKSRHPYQGAELHRGPIGDVIPGYYPSALRAAYCHPLFITPRVHLLQTFALTATDYTCNCFINYTRNPS